MQFQSYAMSENSGLPGGGWFLCSLGAFFILLGVALILIPIIASSGGLSGVKIPWIILYVYHKDGFYFATSPILIIISLIGIAVALLHR